MTPNRAERHRDADPKISNNPTQKYLGSSLNYLKEHFESVLRGILGTQN